MVQRLLMSWLVFSRGCLVLEKLRLVGLWFPPSITITKNARLLHSPKEYQHVGLSTRTIRRSDEIKNTRFGSLFYEAPTQGVMFPRSGRRTTSKANDDLGGCESGAQMNNLFKTRQGHMRMVEQYRR